MLTPPPSGERCLLWDEASLNGPAACVMGRAHSHTDGGLWPWPQALRVEEVMGSSGVGALLASGELPPHLLGQTRALLSSQLCSAGGVGSMSCEPSSWVLG